MSVELYDTAFYDMVAPGSKRSAKVILPLVLKSMPEAHRFLDVGCGSCEWLLTLNRLVPDHYTVGIDGHPQNEHGISHYIRADISQPGSVAHVSLYDLVISLEVAEHLPEERATSFVGELCQMGDVILFSAAIPGQGGVGHVNEQWPGYWVEKFESWGYQVSGALRFAIWDDTDVENWYRQNLLVAVRADQVQHYPNWFETPLARVIPLVHPVLYNDKLRIIRERA